MHYDLIIVGGGPGGLMAAKTAAESGLKVALIERKEDVTKVMRACMQIFYINKRTPNYLSGKTESKRDGYIDPVSAEILPDKAVFHFPVPGFSFEFPGQCRPLLNSLYFSPSGKTIHRFPPNQKVWGFFIQKEAVLATLLEMAENAGAKIINNALAIGAYTGGDGVKIRLSRHGREKTMIGHKLIAADGLESRVVASLGLNQERIARPMHHFIMYVLDGVQGEWSHNSVIDFLIPSLCSTGNIYMSLLADGRNLLGVGYHKGSKSGRESLDGLLKHRYFRAIFEKAKIVGKLACSLTPRTPLSEPAQGNLVVVGDAGAWVETWVQGAIASGYQGAKAVLKELDNKPGNQDYNKWWHKAFAFNTPEYKELLKYRPALLNFCSDEEIDYLFSLMSDDIGVPSVLVQSKMRIVKNERPELYDKLLEKAIPQRITQ